MSYLKSEWTAAEVELTRERGLWGPLEGNPFDKWMLDPTEGPCRMRKKMMRNDDFYVHFPYRPNVRVMGLSDAAVSFCIVYKQYLEIFQADTVDIQLFKFTGC